MLERAVKALKEGRQPELDRPLDHGTEIDLNTPALLPEDYLPDVHTRLIMYKRIASAETEQDLGEMREEVIDRFGLLPDPARNLFALAQLKLKATPMGIRKIDAGSNGARIVFSEQPNVDPALIINLIQSTHQRRLRLTLRHKSKILEIVRRVHRIRILDLSSSFTNYFILKFSP